MQKHKQRLSVLLLIRFILLLFLYLSRVATPEGWIVDFEILQISSGRFSANFLVDNVRLSFGALVTLISTCVFLFAKTYIKDDPFYYRFV